MNSEIENLKGIYKHYVMILNYLEYIQENSEYRTIRNNKKVNRLKNRTLKDMDILYKIIKELGGI